MAGADKINPQQHPNASEAAEVPVDKEHDVSQVERVLSSASDVPHKDMTDYDRVDKDVAKYVHSERVEITPEENKRLRRMIDLRVLAIMVPTYFLQALDKGTISFASIMGIRADLGILDGQKYAWLTTCIYIAVLVVEYPTNWALQRVPIAKYLSVSIILWGTILALHSTATNFTTILVLRTLLGIFEAVCQPAFLILSSMWYKREEQAETVTYWYMMNGGQQIVGGVLAYAFTHIKSGPLKSWQALFVSYGVVSVAWGFFVGWWMPDSPMKAKCFSEEDKRKMVERVRSNQTGLQNKKFRPEQVREAFLDPQTYCYCMIAICTTLPTSGLGAFANIIITGFNFTVLQTQLLAMVLGAVIITILLSSTWLVKRTGQNCLIMGIFVIPSIMGTIVLMTVENHSTSTKVGLLVSYYIVLSFWAAQTLSLSMLSRNIGGQTKKSIVVTMNFVSWCAGNAIGPQVFLSNDAPRYLTAFSTHMGCYGVLVFVIVFLRIHLLRQNKKKDELAAAGIREADDKEFMHAFEDLTDRENPNFRYIY